MQSSLGAGIQTQAEIVWADLTIDLPRQRVILAGQDVHLTPTEYKLLSELAAHPNQVLEHAELLTAVWGTVYRDDLDYLRSYVHMLRRKIETDPANPRILIRVPGVGYMLDTEQFAISAA